MRTILRIVSVIVIGFAGQVASAQTSFDYPVGARANYFQNSDSCAGSPAIIDLAAIGITPGTKVSIEKVGGMKFRSDLPDNEGLLVGAFSSTSTLLGKNVPQRIPEIIDAGSPYDSSWIGGYDVSQDFLIASVFLRPNRPDLPQIPTSVVIDVPAGAFFLFVSALDNLYCDNINQGLGVRLTPFTPPTADAGIDQSIRAGVTVNLDGSASFDDNTASGDLVYAWSFVDKPAGSTATLTDNGTVAPSFVADLEGLYIASLVVTDEDGLPSEADSVEISSENLAPSADAGVDQLVIVNTSVNLDGSESSDPENDTLTYSWTINTRPNGSTATLSDPTTANPSFVPDLAGTYEVTLEVSDLLGPGTPDSVEITATSANGFAENRILAACDIVNNLSPGQVTTKGNQKALCNFLGQAIKALQKSPPHTATAIEKVEKAIERTDGCFLRGIPDGNGSGRDWITYCPAQVEVYGLLHEAQSALTTP